MFFLYESKLFIACCLFIKKIHSRNNNNIADTDLLITTATKIIQLFNYLVIKINLKINYKHKMKNEKK